MAALTTVSIRIATIEDRGALWDWYGEPLHRLAYRRPRLEDPDRHKAWWSGIIANPRVTLCIGLIDIVRIGCVRFDDLGRGIFEVRAYLKPAYCRQNLLPMLLDAAMAFVADLKNADEFRMRLNRTHPGIGSILPRLPDDEITETENAILFRRTRQKPAA